MKKLVSVLMILVLAAALVMGAACGKDPETPANSEKPANSTEESVGFSTTADQLYNAALAVSGFGNMTAVPAADYSDIYGIDVSKIADSAWYVSENPSLNADEIAVFKLGYPDYADTLKGIFESRIARQLQVAQTYSPEEASKLENAYVTVTTEGFIFVYYCIGDNSEAMMQAIASNIK
jgi:hypothetical protein